MRAVMSKAIERTRRLAADGLAPRKRMIVFLVACAAASIWWWGERAGWIASPVPLNPDEAQLAATALNAWNGPWIWLNAHNHTVGPLAPLLAGWPIMIGQEVSLQSVRATGFVVEILSFVLLAAALFRLTGRLYPALAVIPFVAFSGLSTQFDLIHMSSEKFPALALSAALFCVADWTRRRSIASLAAAAFLLGLAPLLKLQALLLGISIGLPVFLFALFPRGARGGFDYRTAAIVAGAALAGPLFFILPLVATGRLDYLFAGYVSLGGSYARPFDVESSDFVRNLVGALFLPLLAAVGTGPGLLALSARRAGRLKTATGAFGVAYFAIALITVYLPGREFGHYAYFLFHAGPVMFGLLVWALGGRGLRDRVGGAVTALGVALPLTVVSIVAAAGSDRAERERIAEFQGSWTSLYADRSIFPDEPLVFDFIPGFGDRMFVWGWMPEYYVAAGLPSVARDTHTQYFKDFSDEGQAFHRNDFMRRADRHWPFPVIDATGPSSFAYTSEDWTIARQFPEFWNARGGELVLVGSESIDCPRLYLPRQTKIILDSMLVHPITITAEPSMPDFDPSALDDFSVYETCTDYWLAAHGAGGRVEAAFEGQPVARVALLNTRNRGWLNHAATEVRITRTLEEVVVGEPVVVRMEPYPTWTYVDFEPGLADAVTIEIVGHDGVSGGLNELKIYSRQF